MGVYKLIKNSYWNTTGVLIDDKKYWKKSPAAILFGKYLPQVLRRHATRKSVLDAGAGRLAYKKMISEYASSYKAIDFKKTHEDLDYIGDIENMSLTDESFDVVFCTQVLEHIPHPSRALGEFYRVLKKEGFLILTAPLHGYIHNAPHDYFRYTKFGLEVLLSEAGFTVVRIRSLGGFFCYIGLIRSVALMPFTKIKIIGKVWFRINYVLSKVDIFLDKLTGNENVFTLNYLVVAKKE